MLSGNLYGEIAFRNFVQNPVEFRWEPLSLVSKVEKAGELFAAQMEGCHRALST